MHMQSAQKNALNRPLAVCLLASLCCLLWGSAAPMIKIGYRLCSISESDTLVILLFAGIRFALAGLMVILFTSLAEKRIALPKREAWPSVLKLSLFQTVLQYFFFYVGVANSSGVHTSILNGAAGLLSILLSCYLFRYEKMTLPKLAGCLLGFGGILAMNLSGVGGGVSLLGEGFVLFSCISNGIAAGLCKRYSRTESPAVLTGWQFLLGGLVMCAVALAAGARIAFPSLAAVGVLLYLCLLSAVAYTLWAVLLKHNPVSNVAIYTFVNPLFGLLLSALILGETAQAFSVTSLIALVLVCAGIVVVNRFGDGFHSTKRHK